jgi:Fe2+ transport system protein B
MNWNDMLQNWVGFFFGTPIRAALTVFGISLLTWTETTVNTLIQAFNALLPPILTLGILYLGLGIMLRGGYLSAAV